jgi:hypothetical protein
MRGFFFFGENLHICLCGFGLEVAGEVGCVVLLIFDVITGKKIDDVVRYVVRAGRDVFGNAALRKELFLPHRINGIRHSYSCRSLKNHTTRNAFFRCV